jgi:ABC-type sugar transport system substrate-binding protein
LKAYPDIHLVSSLSGSGVRDRALKAADDMLQAHPTIKGIFAINDDSALGTLSAAESRHLGNLVIVGYDATPEAQKAILAGRALKADVAQQPRLIGSKTIDAIAAHFANQPAESKLAIPVRIVDAASLRAENPAATTATHQ